LPEEQELRLTVTLDDQASEALGKLQATLQQMGGTAGSQSSTTMNNFANGLRNAGQHAGNLHSSLNSMAARGGFIGGVFFEIGRQVHQMAEEFIKATLDIKAYADAMVNLDQAASRAATSAAQFQRNIAVMRESGISAADAAKNMQGLSDAIADLQRDQSKVRENLLAGLRGAEFEDMRSLIGRVMTGDRQAAYAEIKKFADDIRAYWTARGQAERGALAARQFGAEFGMPDIDKMRTELETVSPELEKLYNQRMDNARRYQTAVEKQGDAWERSIRSLQSTALQVLPLVESMEGFADTVEGITKMLEMWENLIGNANEEKPPPGGGQEPDTGQPPTPFDERFGKWPGGGSTWRIPTPGTEGTPKPGTSWWDWFGIGTGENLPEEREGKLRDALQRRGRERLGGGAQQFAGFGATGGAGGGDRQTAYQTNTEQIEAATEQFKRLNDFFELADLLDMKPGQILLGRSGLGPGGGTGTGGDSSGSTSSSNPTGSTDTTATGPIPPGHEGPLPPVPWPDPSKGNVIPAGFGTEPGTAPGGIGTPGSPAPWTGTVAPGSAGPMGGQPAVVPPGWGPGGSGQAWGSTPGGGAAQYPAGSPEAAAAGGAQPGATTGGGGSSGGLSRSAYDKMFAGSVMAGQYDKVVEVANKNGVPPATMAAIIAFESAKGRSNMIRTRNNPAGLMDPATGMQKGKTFSSIEEGIEAAGRTIGNRYREAGGDIDKMAKRYAPPGAANDPNRTNTQWPSSVRAYTTRLSDGTSPPPPPAAPNPQATSGGPQTTQNISPAVQPPSQMQTAPTASSGLTTDQNGKSIDGSTARQAEILGARGDTAGLQRLFASRGYRMSGPACGIVASKYARDAGYNPPSGGAVATSWHNFGQSMSPEDINSPGRTFGSMYATYWHGRYQGKQGRILPAGETGGHVMTIVPGTYNPKDQTIGIVDQYGFSRRNIKDMDLRIANRAPGAPARPNAPGTTTPAGQYPAVPFVNLPGLGPKPITSDILAPANAVAPASQDLIPGTTLRPGATRTDPGEALDARTLDSSPGQSVNVKGDATVRVNVRDDPKYTTSKETLHKDTPIPRKSAMEPAKSGPTESADAAMEE